MNKYDEDFSSNERNDSLLNNRPCRHMIVMYRSMTIEYVDSIRLYVRSYVSLAIERNNECMLLHLRIRWLFSFSFTVHVYYFTVRILINNRLSCIIYRIEYVHNMKNDESIYTLR
jgi:hypothetical protein